MTLGGSRHAPAAMIMTEDAKTEEEHRRNPLRCVHRNALQVCGLQGNMYR